MKLVFTLALKAALKYFQSHPDKIDEAVQEAIELGLKRLKEAAK